MGFWSRVLGAIGLGGKPARQPARLKEQWAEPGFYGIPAGFPGAFPTYNGMPLIPIFGPDQRPEKNQTLRTQADHDRARNSARIIGEKNPNGIALVERLMDYNVGRGSTTEVHSVIEDEEPPKRLTKKIRKFLKDFRKTNKWRDKQREMVKRLNTDGEFFLRFFPHPDGIVRVRFVEPSEVRPPAGQSDDGPWSYGVYTPTFDVEEPVGYNLHDFRTGTDEYVDAIFVIHVKVNCLSTQKRGIPSLYACEDELTGAVKLRYATREGEKLRNAIAYFRVHEAATKEEVSAAMHDENEAVTLVNQDRAGRPSRTVAYEETDVGGVVDIPATMKPEPPPTSANASTGESSVRQALEAVAGRAGVPYWVVSGDPNATNFAVSLTAESPFVKSLEATQEIIAEAIDDAETKALEIAAEQELFPYDVMEQIDLLVSLPSPVMRNRLEETTRRKILRDNNVMSETTWSVEEGLDPLKQRQQIVEERADAIGYIPSAIRETIRIGGPQKGGTVQGNPGTPGAGDSGLNAPPSGTPGARYAQMATKLKEQREEMEKYERELLRMAEQADATLANGDGKH